MPPEIDPGAAEKDHPVELNRLAAEILSSGSALHFRARGVSMRPCILDGDLLEVNTAPQEDLRIGDILLILPVRRQMLVHRVLRIKTDLGQKRFLLQGDAAPQPDGWLSYGQVLGRVVAIERAGKRWNLNTPARHTLAVLYVAGLTVLKFFYHSVRD